MAYLITQSTSTLNPGWAWETLSHLVFTPNVLVLFICGIGMAVVSCLPKRDRRTKLATSQFAGAPERAAARRKARRQMQERKRNAVTLYIGRPKLKVRRLQGPAQPIVQNDAHTFYLPDAQRGIAVCGGPGSGKTFSVIDPCVRSVIDQGFPLILYDFVRFVG